MSVTPTPLGPSVVASMLRGAAAAFAAEVHALPDAILRWHPAAGEWCVKDVLGHIIEAERRGFAGRIRIILANGRPKLEPWDPAEVSKARKDCEKGADALLVEMLQVREQSVALVAALRPDALARVGLHPTVGELGVADLLQEWVHHDRNHLKQILTNVQQYAWPHMGNAQRFSRP
ncbi:MAG: DinB family protein [Candidatus Rokubacteria bacterium]|nr:DinB family protein [Candidatus Rokubacteria bacterium]